MKKLLLVLLVVTLASFLFVGCLPTTPTEGEGEGEGEAEICPTLTVTSQVVIGGKTYIRGGVTQTLTLTFAVPTEPVSVWIPYECMDVEKDQPDGVPWNSFEVVLYPDADKKVYTAELVFPDFDCCEFYIYVVTCDLCAPCKYPVIVDSVPPYVEIEICIDDCDCAGCSLSFTSTVDDDCDADANCGDDCSGLASWFIDIYDEYPFDDCCDLPCVEPMDSKSGTECPVSWTTECIEFDKLDFDDIFVVVTLVDNVGNDVKYGAWVGPCDYDTCDEIWIGPWGATDCIDDAIGDGVFSTCPDHECLP